MKDTEEIKLTTYLPPVVTVVEFRIESGFAGSIADEIAVNGNNEMVELLTDEGGSEFDDSNFF